MKYVIMLGDGMADFPIPSLGNKTPLEAAYKPNMDRLAPFSYMGMVRTVPPTLKPGSDVANLSAMGYDPLTCYTGRSPLEAVSIGIQMKDTDVAFRCNLVTLSDEADYTAKTMVDYSAEEITTEEADQLIQAVNEALSNDVLTFYTGISYRHCLIWANGQTQLQLTPPHDISDKVVGPYLPKNPMVLDLMERSYAVLKDHPVNKAREARGLHPANSIWLWGEGTRPGVQNFESLYGVKGSVISAVDLIKGIGLCAGMNVIEVEGATGNIHTNFKGKGIAAIKTLLEDGKDLVYIHVEAPDECGHRGETENKVRAIEYIDRDVLGPVLKALEENGEPFHVLVMPDHPTPIALKTHVSDPIPFMLYKSEHPLNSGLEIYSEESCKATGVLIEKGYTLMSHLLSPGAEDSLH